MSACSYPMIALKNKEYLSAALGAGVLGVGVPGPHDDGGVRDEGRALRGRHHFQAHSAVDVVV